MDIASAKEVLTDPEKRQMFDNGAYVSCSSPKGDGMTAENIKRKRACVDRDR